MSLFGQTQEMPSENIKMPRTPADEEAEKASEAAFERTEQAIGKVTINAEVAGENKVIELPQPVTEAPEPQPVDSDHQLTAS